MSLVPISSFCRTGSGTTPSRSNEARYYGGTIPWVKSGELREAEIFDTEEKVTEAALAETALKLVPANSLLVAMYGATVGRVGILRIEATTNQAVCHIVPDPARADVRYMFHVLQWMAPQFVSRGVGGAQPNISQKIVQDALVRLPPLDEQRRIAAILDQADALRRKRRLASMRLNQMPVSLFNHLFGDPVGNEKGWGSVSLGNATAKIGSGATPTGGEASYKTNGISLIRSMNIHDGVFVMDGLAYIDESQAEKLSNVIVRPEDVLLNITGASVARVCRVPETVLPARVNQHVSIIRSSGVFAPEFLEIALLHPSSKAKLLKIGEAGATRQAITKEQIEKFEVIAPPKPDQDKFVQQLRVLAKARSASFRQEMSMDVLFSSLQKSAFEVCRTLAVNRALAAE